MVEDEGARIENLVASHLLRFCHWSEDVLGKKLQLRYFRNTVGHEVDFILIKDQKPWIAIEVKTSEQSISNGLKFLLERVTIPHAFQLHFKGTKDYLSEPYGKTPVRFMPIEKFLRNLP